MEKNLIKISGIYNNLNQGEEFNIFCTMEINIKSALINIKNCEINQENNNLLNFDEQYFNLKNDEIINNTLNNINNLKNNNFEGEINYYIEDLIKFLFQYIYNEYYIEGNMIFETIKLI